MISTHLKSTLCLLMLLTSFMLVAPKKALACCQCNTQVQLAMNNNWPTTQTNIQNRVSAELTGLRTFMVQVVWQDNLLPATMLFADQMNAIAMQQSAIIGTFFDAKHQLETQRTLQKIRARAHKDYHPSQGMCTFGSSMRSLAASERRSELTAHIMSQRFQDRMMGNANSAAAGGPEFDKRARLTQFRTKFCDPMDNGAGLDFLCEHDQDENLANSPYPSPTGGSLGATDPQRMNKDIDYLRTVDYPWTLNIDFTDDTLTDDEEEILALADNLYGHEVFLRPPGTPEEEGGMLPKSADSFPALHQNYMDARALMAKLSVAKNSFNAITSMKAAGTSGSRDFMVGLLNDLGINGTSGGADNIEELLGPAPTGGSTLGPSYHAQMEVLTKKIYQNPDFYTNLYDKPANVERKKVAMQAIGLMQKFDLYKSYLRYEASLSLLLELAVTDLQEQIELQTGDQTTSGESGG